MWDHSLGITDIAEAKAKPVLHNSTFAYILPRSQPPTYPFFFFKNTPPTLLFTIPYTAVSWCVHKTLPKEASSFHLVLQKPVVVHALNHLINTKSCKSPLISFLTIWTVCSVLSIQFIPKWALACKSLGAQTCCSAIKHCISSLDFQGQAESFCLNGYIALSSPQLAHILMSQRIHP